MDLLESAPFNRGKNKLYEGVAGNLVAYACKVSFQNGFDGYLSFTAKTKPIDHYIKTLGTVFFYSGTGWNPNKQMPSSSCNSLRGGFVSNESVTKDNYINLYNQIMIWNEGQLPEDWTIETFLEKHSSKPYNPDIANAFFRSGYIESWGRGITKMTNLCVEAGLPRPTFYYKTSGIWAVFQKDILNEEYLQTLELNDRQVKAVLYA